jgi:hypothetical protein
MTRRHTKEQDSVFLIAQLFGLLILAGLICPPLRAAIYGSGTVIVSLSLIAVVVIFGFLLFRLPARSKRAGGIQPVSATRAAQTVTSFTEQLRTIAKAPNQIQPASSASTESEAKNFGDEQTTPLAVSLAEQLRSIDWFQFEKIVAALYEKQGYEVERRGGAQPDGGIDIVIENLGERTGVQCKHWQKLKVSIHHVREFFAALTDAGLEKGVLVTLRGFSREAGDYAAEHGIEIIDKPRLLAMLESGDARFDPEIISLLEDKRKFCPKCGAEMVLRTAAKGRNAGEQFWGCSNYATRRCRGRLPYQPQTSRTDWRTA